jgi:integral membrane sensor domain MASE1
MNHMLSITRPGAHTSASPLWLLLLLPGLYFLFIGLSTILNSAKAQESEVRRARDGNELFGGFFYPEKRIADVQKDSYRFQLKVWGVIAIALSLALIATSLYEVALWAGWFR